MKYFQKLHPLSAFIYFLIVILIAMLTMNPIIITICYVSGICFYGMLVGIRKLLNSLKYNIPLLLMLALTNPLFVHKGETILFFLNDNPVTLESILYGIFASMMIMSIYYWFCCYSEIMSSDKFIYLFGKVSPKLSLLLSMSLSFIPKLKKRYKEIYNAQKALGIFISKSYVDKIRTVFRILAILLTSSLENAIETSDSMKARGYGLKGRTSYTIYSFNISDIIFLIFSLFVGIGIILFIILGYSTFNYYPTISTFDFSPIVIIMYLLIVIKTGISILLEVKENLLWRYLKSKI